MTLSILPNITILFVIILLNATNVCVTPLLCDSDSILNVIMVFIRSRVEYYLSLFDLTLSNELFSLLSCLCPQVKADGQRSTAHPQRRFILYLYAILREGVTK